MPYPSTVDTGQVQPHAIYEGDLGSTGAGTLTANTAYLVGVTLTASVMLTAMRMRFGSGGAGHYDIGIYDSGGNLLWHSGSVVSATGVQTQTLATPLGLAPGKYWLALWVDNATDTVNRATGVVNLIVTQSGTNASSLPATTAGLTGLTNGTIKPFLIGLIQGGWS